MTKAEREIYLRERLESMLTHERKLRESGRLYIAGVDEVGRGPIAGPVCAAALILPSDFSLLGVDDSKKLSPKKREELAEAIKKEALCYAFGWVKSEVIDNINILQATKLAMSRAVAGLAIRPDHVLIDGNFTVKAIDIPQTAIPGGDAKSVSIAAASILAKVARDRYMVSMSEIFPGYSFENNKGYGTKAHYEGIEKLGTTPIHRQSFLKEK
ncbi:MAG: ribonuclease HII [Clostridiales bacterium]|nr:ribonuclease HII [Clostridiales bacterium]